MKKNKIILGAILLATLAAGCSKEGEKHFRLVAKPMVSSNSKVLVNPVSLTSSWVSGEEIIINAETCVITGSEDDYSITCENAPTPPIYAVYPNGMNSGGNVIDVTYAAGSTTMTLKKLAIDYSDNSHATHKVIFPMASYQDNNNGKLLFDHLTGGLKFTIENKATEQCTLASVKIVTKGADASAVTPQTHKGVTISWENQGLIVPSGEPGTITGDVQVMYASEMRFAMKTNGADNVIIPGRSESTNGKISFCVPVTVRSLEGFTITGYDPNGAEVFTRSQTLTATATATATATIERNKMYTIPTIKIPTQQD